MTSLMGPMEATTLSVGEELNELGGFRSTRLTALMQPELKVQFDIGNADGVAGELPIALAVNCTWDGTTTVLCSDTTGVVVGKYIRLDSDGQVFEISAFTPNVDITILNPGGLAIPSGSGPTSQLVPTIVTLSSGVFVAGVVAATRFRLLGGALDLISSLVNTVDSGTQLTLREALPAFLSHDWEVVQDGDTTAQVETTLDWPTEGIVKIDAVLYTYTGKTITSLLGLAGFDGVDFVVGALQRHEPLAEVLEYSRTFSAIERLRREVFVETALGEDLSRVGRNLAVPRPPALQNDTEYAEFIRATAYAPKGTVWGIELALEALLGETVVQTGKFASGVSPAAGEPTTVTLNLGTFDAAIDVTISNPDFRFRITRALKNPDLVGKTIFVKRRVDNSTLRLEGAFEEDFDNVEWEITKPNWEIFEDFTSGSPLNHNNTVFLRRADTNEEDPNGKTFLDGDEIAATTGPTSLDLVASPVAVQGVRLADEPPTRLIHQGTSNVSISAAGLTVFRAAIDEGFADKASDPGGPARTITDLGGSIAQLDDPGAVGPRAFVAGDVGKMFYVNNATNPANNGVFVVLSVPLPTRITYVNTQGIVNETSGLTWNFSRIAIGDIFQITDGTFAGEIATILNITANLLTLAPATGFLVDGIPFVELSAAAKAAQPQNISYRIYRTSSNFRYVYPSSEFYIDSGGIPVQQWVYGDPPNEPSEVIFIQNHPTDGNYLGIIDPGAGDTAEYTHPLRILPESTAVFEFEASATAPMNNGLFDNMQFAFQIHDGERVITVGYRETTPTGGRFSLIDATTGGPVGSGAVNLDFTSVDGRWASVKVVKQGRGKVLLLADNQLAGSADYTLFPVSSARQLRWGTLETAVLAITPIGFVKYVDWACFTPVELWNAHFANGGTSNANRELADGDTLGLFTVNDVGKTVRIKDFGALNPGGGNALGEWEIEQVNDPNTVVLVGRQQEGAGFTPVDTQRMTVRGDYPFIWPDHRGHAVEFLSGPNAGVFPILEILDPATEEDIEEPVQNPNSGGAFNLRLGSSDPTDGGFGPAPDQYCVIIYGEVAGVKASSFPVNILAGFDTLVSTNFDPGTVRAAELVPCFPLQGLGPAGIKPFKGTLRLFNIDNGLTVFEIPPGQLRFGKPAIVDDSVNWTSEALQQVKYRSNAVRLDAAGGTPPLAAGFSEDEEVPWRLVPVFPTDAGLPFELVDAGSEAAGTLTFRQDINALFGISTGEEMAVGRTTVLSAQALDEKVSVTEPVPGPIPKTLSHYAFWLFDDFGFIRELARDTLTVAGVISDEDAFFRDETGAHLIT